MTTFRSLRGRLLASHLTVAGLGALTVLVAARVLVPRLFDDRVRGNGLRPAAAVQQHDAVVAALDRALLIGIVVSSVVAVVAAVATSHHLLRPLEALRGGTRRLAEGRYDVVLVAPAERELAVLAADVNELARALATTERQRAALVNDVAHEMRTPITTLSGYIDGVADGLVSVDELVALGTDELARLRRLADDLAAVSRAEEGRLALEVGPCDLAEIAGAVVRRLQPQAQANGLRLDRRGAPAVPVTGDRDRLVQALTNVVGNAVNYTSPPGAVVVDIGADPPTVAVHDTGRGLDPDELTRVFERFYRADSGGHARGTGVGLTIARAIARAHGGDLTAASPGRGEGSTFTLVLPATPAPAQSVNDTLTVPKAPKSAT